MKAFTEDRDQKIALKSITNGRKSCLEASWNKQPSTELGADAATSALGAGTYDESTAAGQLKTKARSGWEGPLSEISEQDEQSSSQELVDLEVVDMGCHADSLYPKSPKTAGAVGAAASTHGSQADSNASRHTCPPSAELMSEAAHEAEADDEESLESFEIESDDDADTSIAAIADNFPPRDASSNASKLKFNPEAERLKQLFELKMKQIGHVASSIEQNKLRFQQAICLRD